MIRRFRSVFLPILLLIVISLTSYGGCDIEFGGGGDSNGDNSDIETVNGTVTSIVPSSIPIEGTFVLVNNNPAFSDVLDSSGFFSIQGLFSGSSVRLDFSEQEGSEPFATAFLNIYRGATVDLGNIEIENRDVILGLVVTNFDATVLENNCTGNSGTVEVQTLDNDPDVFVNVSITSTTNIEDGNGNAAPCELVIGEVFIRGILGVGNNVDADEIELQ